MNQRQQAMPDGDGSVRIPAPYLLTGLGPWNYSLRLVFREVPPPSSESSRYIEAGACCVGLRALDGCTETVPEGAARTLLRVDRSCIGGQ